MTLPPTRRHILTGLSLAGAAGFLAAPRPAGAEAPLETTTVRITEDFAICEAPLYIAEELLRAEGFTDVRYVEASADANSAAVTGRQVDSALDFPVLFLPEIDASAPITVLAGVHVGCIELFVWDNIHGIAELKVKSVGLEACPPTMLRLIAAQVGIDLDKDIRGIGGPGAKALEFGRESSTPSSAFRPSPRNCTRAIPAG